MSFNETIYLNEQDLLLIRIIHNDSYYSILQPKVNNRAALSVELLFYHLLLFLT